MSFIHPASIGFDEPRLAMDFFGIGSLLGSTGQALMSMKMQHDSQKWQEKMRQTQYQDTVSDMAKAGINPMFLATGGTTNATPGNPGRAEMPNLWNAYQEGRAKDTAQNTAHDQQGLLRAQSDQADAQARNTNIQSDQAPAQLKNQTVQAQAGLVSSQANAENSQTQRLQAISQIKNRDIQNDLLQQQITSGKATAKLNEAIADYYVKNPTALGINAAAEGNKPALQAGEGVINTAAGAAGKFISKLTGGNSAKSVNGKAPRSGILRDKNNIPGWHPSDDMGPLSAKDRREGAAANRRAMGMKDPYRPRYRKEDD